MTSTAVPVEPLVARLAQTAPGQRVQTGLGTTGAFAYDASNYRVTSRAVYHLSGDRGVRALHLAELLDPAADPPGGSS